MYTFIGFHAQNSWNNQNFLYTLSFAKLFLNWLFYFETFLNQKYSIWKRQKCYRSSPNSIGARRTNQLKCVNFGFFSWYGLSRQKNTALYESQSEVGPSNHHMIQIFKKNNHFWNKEYQKYLIFALRPYRRYGYYYTSF